MGFFSSSGLLTWLLRDVPLEADEEMLWQVPCNRQTWLARGGTLALTNKAVAFQPNKIDGAIGAKSARFDLSTIRTVSSASGGNPLVFGGRRRIVMTLTDGRRERLLVANVDERVRDIAEAAAGP